MNLAHLFKAFSLIQTKDSSFEEIAQCVMGRPMARNANFFAEVAEDFIAEKWYSDSTPKISLDQQRSSSEFAFKDALQKGEEINLSGKKLSGLEKIIADYVNPVFISKTTTLPKFSVVIPTYNGAARIAETITSLTVQDGMTRTDYEIIIVDDGSSDDVGKVVRKELSRIQTPSLYIQLKKNAGPSVARNIGILHSRHEFISFTDDDCVVPHDWLLGFRNVFQENPEIAGAGGWYITSQNQSETVYDQYVYYRRIMYHHTSYKSSQINTLNYCGNTANVCYRKEALWMVGGFNPVFRFPSLDDWELKMRMHFHNFSLFAHPKMVFHKKRLTFMGYVRHQMVRGWGRHLMFLMHGIVPTYYNVGLYNLFFQIILEWRTIFSSQETHVYLPFRRKVAFFGLSFVDFVATWLGKYTIPARLLEESDGFRTSRG